MNRLTCASRATTVSMIVVALVSVAVVSGPVSAEDAFRFRDVLARQGIDPVVNAQGFRTHAAAWGDVDGDGWIDLYVGTMGGDEPATFFWNDKGRFILMNQHPAAVRVRAAGSVFVDFDNDRLLELYVSNHAGQRIRLRIRSAEKAAAHAGRHQQTARPPRRALRAGQDSQPHRHGERRLAVLRNSPRSELVGKIPGRVDSGPVRVKSIAGNY